MFGTRLADSRFLTTAMVETSGQSHLMKQLKKSKRRVELTVRGKAAAVAQDAEVYQRPLDSAARVDAEEGIRQGFEDAKKGKIRPAKEFFDEFEAKRNKFR